MTMEFLMYFLFSLILTCVITSCTAAEFNESRIHDEQRLYTKIMTRYLKTVRPMVNDTTPLQVLFSLRLNQIVNLNERQQVLTTNVFIDQSWTDPALSWDPTEFKDVRSLRIPADQIWKPDTFIYNNADNGSTGFIHGTYIQIRHTGGVLWPVPVRLRSSCVVKIAYFPFDYQICMVRFGSWIYSLSLVDYDVREDVISVDLSTYIKNSEWELITMRLEKSVANRSRGLGSYPHLTAILYLKRNTFYYLFNIIVPCVMLSMLTLMTFWLPPTSGEKVTLGLSVFLAFSMFMLLIAEEVPASSEAVPLIGIYLCVVMTMTSLSVICAVLVTNLHNRGSKLKPAPRWLASLCIRYLAIPFHSDYCQFFILHDNRCARMNMNNNNVKHASLSICTDTEDGGSTLQQKRQNSPEPSLYHDNQDFHSPDVSEAPFEGQCIEMSEQTIVSPLLQTSSDSPTRPLIPHKKVCLKDEVNLTPSQEQETPVDTVTSSLKHYSEMSTLASASAPTSPLAETSLPPHPTTAFSQQGDVFHQVINRIKSIPGKDSTKFHDHYRITPCLTHESFCECSKSGENIWVPRDDFISFAPDTLQPACSCHAKSDSEDEGRGVLIQLRHNSSPSSDPPLSKPRAKQRHFNARTKNRRRTDPTYENPKLVLRRAKMMIAEWCTIAKVVDRLLFTLSLLATIFTYVFILVLLPAGNNIKLENITFANSMNTGQYRWN